MFHCYTLLLYNANVDYVSLQVISKTMSDQHVVRSLLQAPETDVQPPIMFNGSAGPCIMLWAQNLFVGQTESSKQWTDLAKETPSLSGSQCNSTNSL